MFLSSTLFIYFRLCWVFAAAQRGCPLTVVPRLLAVVASLVVGLGLQGARASVVVVCGFNSCSSLTLEHRLNSCGA